MGRTHVSHSLYDCGNVPYDGQLAEQCRRLEETDRSFCRSLLHQIADFYIHPRVSCGTVDHGIRIHNVFSCISAASSSSAPAGRIATLIEKKVVNALNFLLIPLITDEIDTQRTVLSTSFCFAGSLGYFGAADREQLSVRKLSLNDL